MLQMKKPLFILLFTFSPFLMLAQYGIYSEAEIKEQSQYLETEVAKYQANGEKQRNLLKALLEEDRTNHAAYYQLARIELAAENFRDALSYAEKAIGMSSDNKWYYLLAADIAEKQLDYKQANSFIEKAIKVQPGNTILQYRIAHNLVKNGSSDSAIKELYKIEQIAGINEKSTYLLVDLLNEQKKFNEGAEAIEKLLGLYPDNVDHMNALAYQYDMSGNAKKALQLRNKILEIDPQNVNANVAVLHSEEKKGKGKDNYLFAIKPLIENQSIPIDDKIKELIPYIETVSLDDQDQIEALRSLSEGLVATHPDEAKAHALRGDVMYLTGAPEAALQSYDRTLDLNDKVYSVWLQRMEVLYTLSDYNQLKDFAEEAIDYFPNKSNSYFWQQIGSIKSDKLGDLDLYSEELSFMMGNKMVDDPNQITVDALKLLAEGDASQALNQIKKLDREWISTQGFIAEIYADILWENGDQEGAIDMYKSARSAGNFSTRLDSKIQ